MRVKIVEARVVEDTDYDRKICILDIPTVPTTGEKITVRGIEYVIIERRWLLEDDPRLKREAISAELRITEIRDRLPEKKYDNPLRRDIDADDDNSDPFLNNLEIHE